MTDKVEDSIIALSEQAASEGKILYLSALGIRLREKGHKLPEDIKGRTLLSFIQEEMADRLTVLRSTRYPEKVGVVPAHSNLTFDPISEVSLRKPPRVRPEIWLAFSRLPAPEYERQILRRDGRIVVEDVPKSRIADSTAIRVGRDYIQEWVTGQTNHAPRVHDAIRRFFRDHVSELSQKSISFRDILDESANAPQRSAADGQFSARDAENFFQLMSKLSAEDVRRIDIPVDIILKIMKL